MKFSNRLEAYLSWISTGIKPEDFDDEPRNMTEYWLQGEADRLDRMSGNKAPVATRSLKKGAGDEKYDYADLENKPIQPYVEGDELVENKYYFTLPEVKHPVKNEELSKESLLNIDTTALIADIPNFTYDTSGQEAIVTFNSITPDPSGDHPNILLAALKGSDLGEEDEDILVLLGLYPVYASKHKNSVASGMFYFDENGWLYKLGAEFYTFEKMMEEYLDQADPEVPYYYISGHCDDAFEISVPANIFQYVDGKQKSLLTKDKNGTGLYDHQIKIVKDSYNQLFIQILSTSKDVWVYSDIVSFLRSLNDADYKAYGWSEIGLIDYIGLQSGSLITGYHVGSDYSLPLNEAEVTITDNVIKL